MTGVPEAGPGVQSGLQNGVHDGVEHHEVVIVGAGQAGLSLSWHLTQAGTEHVLLERDDVASDWKNRRWDNFTLVTPNWQCRLPGYSYSGPEPHGFMPRDEVHAFIRRYADTFGAPVRAGVRVDGMQAEAGGYRLTTTAGDMTAGNVVIATGGYQRPTVPAATHRFDASVHQLHSADYRSPAALPEGAVLVVGSGQSGAQIAEDLHLAGRQVHLAVGSAPRVARFYRGRDCVAWLQDMGTYDVPVGQQVGALTKRERTNHYVTGRGGGRDIDLRRFALEGMRLYGRLDAVHGAQLSFRPTLEAALDGADLVAESIKDLIDGYISRTGIQAPVEARYRPVWRPEEEPVSLDLAAEGVTSVIWSTGFRSDYGWVGVPVFDGAGHPVHTRGVTAVPGVFFLGLPWLHTWGSGRFAGIARDAGHLAEAIARRRSDAGADARAATGPRPQRVSA